MPRTRALALLLALLAVPAWLPASAAGVSTTSSGVTASATWVQRHTVVLRSQAISMAAPEIANTMRGEYEWLGSATVPEGFPARDVYYRDQVAWSRIEPSPGVYDFSWFDAGIARAHELGGKFGFRVMAWCPGCWLDATPSWLPRQPGTDIPAWDDEGFLAAWDRLMTALGDRYAGDPAMGWVDVGGYGAWGEWHTLDGSEISVPDAVRVMSAVLDHFPTQHVVINAMVPKYVDAAMALSPRMGLRVDCLGEYNMFSLLPTSPKLQERWKTAPVLSEWCSTTATSTLLGAAQVRQFHVSQVASPNGRVAGMVSSNPQAAAGFVDAAKASGYRYVLSALRVPTRLPRDGTFRVRSLWRNDGSAPTYDDWQVSLQVRKRGHVIATTDLGVDLRSVLPGISRLKSTVSVGALRPGRYSLWVTVTDPTGYLAPMNLAVAGRTADGAYQIGKVRVRERVRH
jgi:hypothetical protein